MGNDKFTTSPSNSDKVSHNLGSSSSARDDERDKEKVKNGIINRIINYVLKQKWWVVVIFIAIGVGIYVLVKFL